jgi:hypothetical protein
VRLSLLLFYWLFSFGFYLTAKSARKLFLLKTQSSQSFVVIFLLNVFLSFRRKEKSSQETLQTKSLIFVELLVKISPYVEMTNVMFFVLIIAQTNLCEFVKLVLYNSYAIRINFRNVNFIRQIHIFVNIAHGFGYFFGSFFSSA